MSQCLFIRLVAEDEKEVALAAAVQAMREGRDPEGVVFAVDPSTFSQVPRSPFAYWASDRIRRLFSELPPFEGAGRTVRVGLQTSDDTRFVRAWWEVAPERIVTGTPETTPEDFRRQTFAGKRWVPFAKVGEYSPYYADLHLVVNWERDGEEIRNYIDPNTGRPYSRPQNTDFYFRPGLTYPLRLHRMSVTPLPRGSIISVRGWGIFGPEQHLLSMMALLSSSLFDFLAKMLLGRFDYPEFVIGALSRVPVPPVAFGDTRLTALASKGMDLQREFYVSDETAHVFCLPALLRGTSSSLIEAISKWHERAGVAEQALAAVSEEIDGVALQLYGIGPSEFRVLQTNSSWQTLSEDIAENEDAVEADVVRVRNDGDTLIADMLSYCLGVAFGRWDIRLATGQRPMPELPDPFAPLPVCSPGMLTGPTGLPARPEEVLPDYPIPIQWDGVIPDDEGHPRDLIAQIHWVFGVLFPDRDPREVEAEACAILGVRDLRSWFVNHFFQYHIKCYSKGGRKAPIYWQLRSARKSYSIWLYYHRLTGDTLWTVLRNYVDPKLEHEQQVLAELKAKLEVAQKAGQTREERRLVREIQKQEQLLEELTQFRTDIYEVASMGYEPDRDDGVLISIAPLHKLVPWSEAARTWRELQEGKYPWSTMHKRLGIRNRDR
ncbi:hypothetical protein [Symbiobacterium terraclitae]|uniref:hypothetical protein n=1 Tax=Symbiobacterium terraclitae TaxID=557451 RepID=UPI0035B54F23